MHAKVQRFEIKIIKHQNENLENFEPWQCYIEVIQYKQILKSSYSILQKDIKVLHAKVCFFFVRLFVFVLSF